MSLEDLNLILKKDPVITTFPVASLRTEPGRVERDYLTHAKTHLSLGDTSQYVDTVFRWVSGGNKGAFVGAVVGDYGEGKTSFLVHIWQESAERQVFTVPPFEWKRFEEIADAVAAWIDYILSRSHPELAKRAEKAHAAFRRRTLEEVARTIAKERSIDYEVVMETLTAGRDLGVTAQAELSADRLLDYVAEATTIVQQAGYRGLLLLLDEPEVAAKVLSTYTVAHFLFDVSNQLALREGNYGVFLSMPENFLATALSQFSSLTARLQARGCFPRLRDIYGADFATQVWSRYCEAFELGDPRRVASAEVLEAIGQVGASERNDLSYGPRSVVSAFRCMVRHFQQDKEPYLPQHFVGDCLSGEITVKPDYPTKIRKALRSPEVTADNRAAVTYLAGFPSGLRRDLARQLGIEELLLALSGPGSLAYKAPLVIGLRDLRRGESESHANVLMEAIQEIDNEFAPNATTLEKAKDAFVHFLIPELFKERKGAQLLGWQQLAGFQHLRGGAYLGTFLGAFDQTEQHFPQRAAAVMLMGTGDELKERGLPALPETVGVSCYDLLFLISLRWSSTQQVPAPRMAVVPGDPGENTAALVFLALDLTEGLIRQDAIAEVVGGAERLTPLWTLNLLESMSKVTLPKTVEADWQAIQGMLVRDLLAQMFGQPLAEGATEAVGEPVTEGAATILGEVSQKLLLRRYPGYHTLIRQPRWQTKVGDYINALNSTEVPLACKRGREVWRPTDDQAARVLGAVRMNLSSGAYSGYESLIHISSRGRSLPLEVQFLVHPLEREISERIAEQPMGPERKFKVDGQECWYMPVSEMLPLITSSGYTTEELEEIIKIGRSRGSFDIGERRGERVLYRKPIDPDDMKAQLFRKLGDLEAELADYRKLPDFASSFDCAAMKGDIEALQDEADYERLLTRLNKEFEQLHTRLPAYFDRLNERLRTARHRAQVVRDRLAGSREVSALKNLPQGKSTWCSHLGRYIAANLKRTADELRSSCDAATKAADRAVNQYIMPIRIDASASLALLLDGYSAIVGLEEKPRQLDAAWQYLQTNVQDYESWLRLLVRSDQLYNDLVEMQQESAHEAKAAELFQAFDDLSAEICEHLELRNLQGLPAHRQYFERVEEIEKQRMGYILGLKAEFDRRKGLLNGLLEALALGVRVRTAFDPTDISGCYDRLFNEAVDLIQTHAVGKAQSEMDAAEQEIVYTRDVLRSVGDAKADATLRALGVARAALNDFAADADSEWLRESTEPGEADCLSGVSDVVAQAFNAIRQARQLLHESVKPNPPKEGNSKLLYDLLGDKTSIDLKALVLNVMANEGDPSHALDVSLDSLADLFRRNCIQVTVQRRRL